MSLSKTIEDAQILNLASSKAKRSKFRQQRRRDQIQKIMSSSRKQIILSNKKSERAQKIVRSQPQNKQKLKQLLQILEKGQVNSEILFDLWIYLKSYINFFKLITEKQLAALTKFGLNVLQQVNNSLESRHSLQHVLLIILNWIGVNYRSIKNYDKKIGIQLQYENIIALCFKTLELDIDILNPYAFLCLGNFVKIPEVKLCLLRNYDICGVYNLKINSQVVEDLSFFTLNLLSAPLETLPQNLAQNIVSFLQKRFFMINNLKEQQQYPSYFFLRLDYLQIIDKLTHQRTLPNKSSKKKIFPKLAYLFQLFNEIKWVNQQDNGQLFGNQKYENIYWRVFTRLCSIPLGQLAFDLNTMKTVFKLSIVFLQNKECDTKNLQAIQQIYRKKSQVWQFLITFCKYQSNGFPKLINNFYLYVLKDLLQDDHKLSVDKSRQFLCEVDEQADNPKSKNIQILQYICNQIKYEQDPKALALLLQKAKRMLRSLKHKQYDCVLKHLIDLRLKQLSQHQEEQVRKSASQISLLLEIGQQHKYQRIEKYQYDNANQPRSKSKENQSKTSRFTFTD